MMTFLKKPSAWLPIAMSGIALLLIIGYVAVNGAGQSQGDEGMIARIFQLILVAQIPIIGYFIVRWFPKHRIETLGIVVIQIFAALIPICVIMLLE